jgi:hypothetical protein
MLSADGQGAESRTVRPQNPIAPAWPILGRWQISIMRRIGVASVTAINDRLGGRNQRGLCDFTSTRTEY